eukprot:5691288-Pleurochrysis_carterae.AAC.3
MLIYAVDSPKQRAALRSSSAVQICQNLAKPQLLAPRAAMLQLLAHTFLLGFYTPPNAITDPDYIIAGGGGAGCAVAGMLAKAGKKVVVLEEGPEDDTAHDSVLGEIVPYNLAPQQNTFFQFAASDITRNMFSEPVWEYDRDINGSGFISEKHNVMLNLLGQLPEGWQRKSFEHTAKIVGGNTMHNYQIWIRPGRESLAMFGEGEDWNIDELEAELETVEEEYLKLPPGFTFNNTFVNQALLGKPYGPESKILAAAIKGGAQAVEYGRNMAAVAHENNIGVAGFTEFTRNSIYTERISSARAFLTPEIRALPNIEVRALSKVTKLIVDENKKCTGVEYTSYDGTPRKLYAGKDVILSMGSIDSPHMMMLSGIGPRDELEKFDIPVVHELPGVGKNLDNHLLIPMFLGSDISETGGQCAAGCAGLNLGYKYSSYATPGGDPDMQYISIAYTDQPEYGRTVYEYYLSRQLGGKSRGEIRLKSADPNDFPELYMGYYEGEGAEDIEVIKENIERFRTDVLAHTDEFYEIGPGEGTDLDYWVKRTAGSYWHWSG